MSLRVTGLTRERADALAAIERDLGGRAGRRPAAWAVLVVAAVFVALVVAGLTGERLAVSVAPGLEDLDSEVRGLAGKLIAVVAVAGLITRLGWWRHVGFVGPSQWRAPALLLAPLLVALAFLAVGVSAADLSDPARLALELPQPLLTGFWEETLVRGFLLHVLLLVALRSGRGALGAVVASSVVFGLLHLINLVDAPPAAVASQVLYATLFGVGFAALLLRTNALPALIVAHALINLGPALRAPGAAVRRGRVPARRGDRVPPARRLRGLPAAG